MFNKLPQAKLLKQGAAFYNNHPTLFKAFAGTALFAAFTLGVSLRLLVANLNQANVLSRAERMVTEMESAVGRMNAHGERLANLPTAEYVVRKSAIDAKSADTALTGSINARLDSVLSNLNRIDKRYEKIVSVINDNESLMASLPAITPSTGWISSNFGHRVSPFTKRPVLHRGLDIGAEVGTPIRATADGVIEEAGYSPTLGKFIVIDHGYNIRTKYAHASELLVKKGDIVKRGKEVSLVGSTGRSTGPHLHYEVWVGENAVDPSNYLLDIDFKNGSTQMSGFANAIGGDEIDLSVASEQQTTLANVSATILIKKLIAGINMFAMLILLLIAAIVLNVSWQRYTAAE